MNKSLYYILECISRAIPKRIRCMLKNEIFCALTRLKIISNRGRYSDVLLEIGSGAKRGEKGWLTLDMNLDSDVYWDLNKKMPFRSGSIAVIYSSHLLEHFYYHELVKLLDDCYRVLKDNGQFLACVPNARYYLKTYFEPDAYSMFKKINYSDLPIDTVNYIAYMDGNHKYMFDESNLIYILKNAGFKDVELREFDPSIDLLNRKYESIYVKCRK